MMRFDGKYEQTLKELYHFSVYFENKAQFLTFWTV